MNKKIYHLVSSKRYTGGAQVAYLWHKALLKKNLESYFIYEGNYKFEEKIKNEKNNIAYKGIFDKIKKIKNLSKDSILISHLSEDHWYSLFFKGKKIYVFHNLKSIRTDYLHRIIYNKNQKVIYAFNFNGISFFKNYKIFYPVYDLDLYKRGNQPNSFLNLCTIGKLEKERRHERFIYICKEIKNLNFPFKGFVIGKGSYLKDLIDLRDDLNLKDEIEFVGYHEDEELARILFKMDFVLWVSEGSQLSHRAIAEGIICGAVPCSFNMYGIDAWIEDGKTGLIINEDYKNSASKIVETFKDKERYLFLRENSYKNALKKVDIDNFVKEFLNFLYEDSPSIA